MSAIIVREEIIHYEVLGRGRPIIFLHGWVGSWRYWIPAMQAASIQFRAYGLDLWGFGDSAKNPVYYTLEQQVDLLDQFMIEMGIAKVALIGHGLGAVVALQYAARFPKVVDRVMAISLPASERSINPRMLSATPPDLAEWLLARNPGSDVARAEAPKADPKALQISLVSLQNFNLPTVAAAITTPCLIVHGSSDPAVTMLPPEQVFFLPEHVHTITFDQSGHFPMLDETSKFNRLMADFLALASGTSPKALQLKEEWKRRIR